MPYGRAQDHDVLKETPVESFKHVALEQLEVERGEEAITKGISDGLVSDKA